MGTVTGIRKNRKFLVPVPRCREGEDPEGVGQEGAGVREDGWVWETAGDGEARHISSHSGAPEAAREPRR